MATSIDIPLPAEPQPRRWTRDEYYQMAELGWFQDQRVELIDGDVVQMTPQKNAHAVALKLCEIALEAAFGDGYWVRMQLPLDLTSTSSPEPDLAVARGAPRDFAAHPSTALLVMEVSDTTLAFDRGRKALLYASAGIAEYWIVNLVDQRLEVFRLPTEIPPPRLKIRYGEPILLAPEQSIAPLAMPGSPIQVADLLP
jgi:Uma2 family endonuclease